MRRSNLIRESVVEFKSWSQCVEYLDSIKDDSWVFRGQADFDWSLVTRLERDLASIKVSGIDILVYEAESIRYFQHHSRGLLDREPPEQDLLSWLALMQHYRAPTRLLDWSFSPYVALFFAYERPEYSPGRKSAKDSAIWLFNARKAARLHRVEFDPIPGSLIASIGDMHLLWNKVDVDFDSKCHQKLFERAKHVIAEGIDWPLPIVPNTVDTRVAAQQSVFTLHGSLTSISRDQPTQSLWMIPEDYPLVKGETSTLSHLPFTAVQKVRLRNTWRNDALAFLKRSNITPESLFPGLDGIGMGTSLHIQWQVPTCIRGEGALDWTNIQRARLKMKQLQSARDEADSLEKA